MLTGRRAFGGEDVSDTLANVLKVEPAWERLPAEVPARMQQVIRACLQKDVKRRIADVQDVRLALEGAFDAPAPAAVAETQRTGRAGLSWLWVAAALIVGAIVAGLAVRSTIPAATPQPVRRLLHTLPSNLRLNEGAGTRVALSPDGRTLVYRAIENGVWRLYRRALDQLDATPIPGTEGAGESPFFSPDGQWVGFSIGTEGSAGSGAVTGTTRTLMKASLAGGRRELSGPPRGASWGLDDTIIVGLQRGGLGRIPASGGDVVSVAMPDDGRLHWYPQFLPNGRAVLFTASAPEQDAGDVMALDLGTGTPQTVVQGGVAGRFLPTGHVVFLRGGDVWAVRFDPDRLAVTGPAVLVEQGLRVEPGGAIQFAVADDGTLAYIPEAAGAVQRSLAWVDRMGREEPLRAPARAYQYPRLSPDGHRVAVSIIDQQRDVWTWDLAGQTLTRLTFDPRQDDTPVWSPDNRHLVFASSRGAAVATNLYRLAADGTGGVERLTQSPSQQLAYAITPDGTQILFREGAASIDLMRLTLQPVPPSGVRTPTTLIGTRYNERNAEPAPTGQWLAYDSDESGPQEIYVRPFPNVDAARWQVSIGGGRAPLWSRDGRELFYVSPDNSVMGVRVEPGAAWRIGAPVRVI